MTVEDDFEVEARRSLKLHERSVLDTLLEDPNLFKNSSLPLRGARG